MTAVENRPVITLIGAGSRVFGFNMCMDICQTDVLKGSELRLVDVAEDRLSVMESFFRMINERTNMDLKISAHTERRVALPESDYVIVSVAEDRIARWEKDLAISQQHGIIEAQGECGGPGGLSLTLRNIPLVLAISRDIEQLCPKAVQLNFSNPMTRVCLATTRYTKVETVGLCHGLVGTQRKISDLLGLDTNVAGCGINHFNWIYDVTKSETGESIWNQACKAFAETDMTGHAYGRELLKTFGRIVSPADGHISDFIHHWRDPDNGMKPRYDMKPKEMGKYWEMEERNKQTMEQYLNGEQDPFEIVHGLSGEGAIPIMCAHSGLQPEYREIAVNIPNDGYITNLPHGSLVEVPGKIGHQSIRGESMGEIPEGIRSLITRQLEIASLAVDAAVEGSYEKALQALAIDPLIDDLAIAERYLRDILEAHADWLPQFS